MRTPDPTTARWFTSSRSTNNGDCVECAVLPDGVAVRDSKDRSGPVLVFPARQWAAFVAATPARSPGQAG
ncbi:DUF397 domain-containing protein [Micromonospora wenchangensis]|uniref:DUF397 domain-containing protein n=1 Tax=Micromonospora wenchangensis TaxID=1185415 RepID=A0A246RKZ4_9ACTN|nr:DUF397 domain-containing protein [Micromonospora wenchangensis]OWV06532.1 hypothetical protein B5D80_15940 [Micromonospora wenchangensis]